MVKKKVSGDTHKEEGKKMPKDICKREERKCLKTLTKGRVAAQLK